MFTSKELFMMNAGDKRYILTDGFADVYQATPQEEEEWKEELFQIKVELIKVEQDQFRLNSAVDTLFFLDPDKATHIIEKLIQETTQAQRMLLRSVFIAAQKLQTG